MKFKRYPVFIFFLLLASQSSIAQAIRETGLPYVDRYTTEEYGAFDQNWAITQDSLGIMYFANGDGVLSYNGAVWRLIELSKKESVFALHKNDDGIIYVGAVDELGYLDRNNTGELVYVSMLPKLPMEFHDFGEIRTICSTNKGVFFGSKKYIFHWDGTHFYVRKNSGDPFLFSVNNTLFNTKKEKGLMVLRNGQFELLQDGRRFKGERIYSILPYNQKDALIITRDQLFVFNGETFTRIIPEASDFFKDNILYAGAALKNGTFALGSLQKGILVIDSTGHTMVSLSQPELLGSNCVFGLFLDQSGILWAALNSGIAKIEYPSPFSFYTKLNGSQDLIFDFQRYNGTLYTGGPDGLYALVGQETSNSFFEPIPGEFSLVWDLVVFEDKMLIGSSEGIFEMDDTGNCKKLFDLKVSTFCHSKIEPARMYVGTAYGLTAIYHTPDGWKLEFTFEGINHNVDKIIETVDGQLWLDIDKSEVIRLSFSSITDARSLKDPENRTFTSADGLPGLTGDPYIFQNQFYWVTDQGGYRFDSGKQRFYKDLTLLPDLDFKTSKINYIDEKGRIWFIGSTTGKRPDQLVVTHDEHGEYSINSLNEQRIIDIRKPAFYAEPEDSVLWYNAHKGIIRHDLKETTEQESISSKAVIYAVLWQNDSLLYGGYGATNEPVLPFKNNQLRFDYASPSFYMEKKSQFQYYLDGFEDDWSPWTSELRKDYTNIPEGTYIFRVHAMNIYGKIGSEDAYSFTILPPWYRSWWAYLFYVLGAVSFLVIIIRVKNSRLRKKNEALEEIVKERTAEILTKNKLLSLQTEKLVRLNESKSKLYANITHEFRTPLTVILGMTDSLEANVSKKHFDGAETSLDMISRNGKNLLQLVNDMLDLAKSESGNMSLQWVQTDVVPLIKYLSESFHSLAEQHAIQLIVFSKINELIMDLDIDKLNSIISNLLSNAIKFTNEHGEIIIHIDRKVKGEQEYLFIKVKDDGPGIQKDSLPHVFDRFYQIDNPMSTAPVGSGVGLSLVREYVELMNGTVEVKSGNGTEFIIYIPVSRTAPLVSKPLVAKNRSILSGTPTTDNRISNSGLPLILIIEDNHDVAYYLRTCLKGTYESKLAIDGKTGVEMAIASMPDIIICDVMMPVMDGYAVCKLLKNDWRTDHIPIILLTAKATQQDKVEGLSYGADAYLTKPFEKSELFTRIEQLILLRKKMIEKLTAKNFSSFTWNKDEDPQTKFIQKLVEVIYTRLDDSDFGSAQLGQEVQLSESQLYRKIKAITGKSTAVFVRSIRLREAKERLEHTDKNVSQVAYETGFNNPSWFSRAFKDEFGFPPSEIHRLH